MSLSLLVLAFAPIGGVTLNVPTEFPTIQSAIDVALPGDTVLVADGTYKGEGNRNLRFTGKSITVRSASGSESCIIDCEGTPIRPQRGFIFDGFESQDAVLRGFTITGGATEPGAIADRFNGAAILIQASSPTIRDCRFVNNHAGCWGGAVYAGDTHPTLSGNANPVIENCLFENNLADDEGGGFFSWGHSIGSSITIRNSVFVGNTANTGGGGLCSFGGTGLVLDHVTIVGNQSPFGPEAWMGTATVTNSIIWSEDAAALVQWSENSISNSLIKGGAEGPGNLDVDPLFKADGFHLRHGSPCIDAAAAGDGTRMKDIDGDRRRIGLRRDIGADEARPQLWPTSD